MSAAIPTVYRDVRFRSRLEATWAAFFDQIGWPWKYEPIDLAGYIPDFILGDFHEPMLVEVKPILTLRDLEDDQPLCADAIAKIKASGWQGAFLLVGVGPFENERSVNGSRVVLGMEGDYDPRRLQAGGSWEPEPDEDGWAYGWAMLAVCPRCDHLAWNAWYGPSCRRCGAWKSDLIYGPWMAKAAWARAQNQTQWKGAGDETRHDRSSEDTAPRPAT